MNIIPITADTKKLNYMTTPKVTQNDTVVFIVKIQDNGIDEPLPTGSTYTLTSLRLDGVSIMSPSPGTITGDNEVTFNLGTKELEFPGLVRASVQIFNTDGRVSTLSFDYAVVRDLSVGFVESEMERTLIEIVLVDGPEVIQSAKDATVEALDAAEVAVQVAADTIIVKDAAEQERIDTKVERLATEMVREDTEALKESIELVRDNTESVRLATEQVRLETLTVRTDTLTVKDDTITVKDSTELVRQATESERLATEVVRQATEQSKNETDTVREATAEERLAIRQQQTAFEDSLEGKVLGVGNVKSENIAPKAINPEHLNNDDSFFMTKKKPFNLMEHPAVDIVYDSCYRKVAVRSNAENMVLDSGHAWSKLAFRGESPAITHEVDGSLWVSGQSADIYPLSGWLIEGFVHENPYIEFRVEQSITSNWTRMYYLKYINEGNWIGIRRTTAGTFIILSVNGVVTEVASYVGYNIRLYPTSTTTLKAEIREVHISFGTSSRAVVVYESGQEVLKYGITAADWGFLKDPGKVGFGSRTSSNLYGFKAGVSYHAK